MAQRQMYPNRKQKVDISQLFLVHFQQSMKCAHEFEMPSVVMMTADFYVFLMVIFR